jgi:hypothetical protein
LRSDLGCRVDVRKEAVIFWVVVDLCIYFDDSKSLPSKGLYA